MASPLTPVFARVDVDHLVRGSTRVTWRLWYQFDDAGPYHYTLQVAPSSQGDWEDVGIEVDSASYLTDATQRQFGINPTAHYRVKLRTDVATYYSPPTPCTGVLDPYHWPRAREIIRQEKLLLRSYTGLVGLLYKRRRTGEPAPGGDPKTAVVDPLGGVVRRRPTYGVPYAGGYFDPVPFDVGIEPGGFDEEVKEGRGPADSTATSRPARVVLIPPVDPRDLFVARDGSDTRFYIRPVKHLSLVKGIPVVARAELRQVPFDDPAYDLPLP